MQVVIWGGLVQPGALVQAPRLLCPHTPLYLYRSPQGGAVGPALLLPACNKTELKLETVDRLTFLEMSLPIWGDSV